VPMNTHYVFPALIVGALAACTSADEAIVADQQPVSAKGDALVVEWGAQDHLTLAAALLDFAPARLQGALLPKPIDTLLAAWGARPLKGCVHGSTWLDGDADGIPARWRADLDCYVTRPSGLSVQIRGGVSVADSDDSVAMSGYQVAFEELQVGVFLNRVPVIARTLDGTARIDAMGPSTRPAAKFGLQGDLELRVDRSRAKGGSMTSYHGKLTGAYAADPDVAFTMPLSRGLLELDQYVEVTVRGHEPKLLHANTAPTLHLDVACRDGDPEALPFDAGAYIAELDRTVVLMKFDGCGEWKAESTPVLDETVQSSRGATPDVPALAQPAPKPTHTGDPPDVPAPEGP
jgi:hypothetical protein